MPSLGGGLHPLSQSSRTCATILDRLTSTLFTSRRAAAEKPPLAPSIRSTSDRRQPPSGLATSMITALTGTPHHDDKYPEMDFTRPPQYSRRSVVTLLRHSVCRHHTTMGGRPAGGRVGILRGHMLLRLKRQPHRPRRGRAEILPGPPLPGDSDDRAQSVASQPWRVATNSPDVSALGESHSMRSP